VRACDRCGESNEDRARFCLECGASLVDVVPRREERKRVSVLFCDLVGFTARAEQMDVEDVRSVLATYYGRLRSDLQRYGGTVEKFIGDAVMALFGAPVARGDDPERAVRAGLAICESIRELNAADPLLDLHVRIGVTTGEALVALEARPSQGEGMASGDVVNSAARLQAATPVDCVLVDESTRRATDRHIAYTPAPPVTAKGKSDPIEAWQAARPRASQGVEVDQSSRAPLVGRERELSLLAETLARVQAARSPRLLIVSGVAGIGKSRLVWELRRVADAKSELITWRQGRCLPYGDGIALWALGEIIKAQAGVMDSDSSAATDNKLRQAVTALVPDRAEAAWVKSYLNGLVGVVGDRMNDDRTEAFAAWRRFVEALAATGPTVLVIEDLHWADEQLLDFVDHLINWSGSVPLLVVATTRPELFKRRTNLAAANGRSAVVQLSGLSEVDIGRLLDESLGRLSLSPQMRSAVVDRSGGNPLYAEEYVRMLADRERAGDLGQTRVGDRNNDVPLPETVEGIIAARLDALDPPDKALMQDAAVLGKVGWAGALAAVSGIAPSTVRNRIQDLDRREFLRLDDQSTVAGEQQYAFRHVLVRDVAYQHLPRRARADRHQRAATWLQSLPADRSDDRAELLAHHWQAAYQYARASRQPTSGLALSARLAMRAAGDRALSLNDFEGADRWYSAALELWPHDDADRPLLLLRLGEAQVQGTAKGSPLLAEAANRLLTGGDVERAAEAYQLQGLLLHRQGKPTAARELYEQALTLLSGHGPSKIRATILGELARHFSLTGHSDDAFRTGTEALHLAEELGLRDQMALAYCVLGNLRIDLGDASGIADLERAVGIALKANYVETAAMYGDLANALIVLGNLPRGFALQEKARESAQRFGVVHLLRHLEVERIVQDYLQGDWKSASQRSRDFIASVESGSPHDIADVCWQVQALIGLGNGTLPEAISDAQRAAELGIALGYTQALLPNLTVHARALFANGRVTEAQARVDDVLATNPGQRAPCNPDWCGSLAIVLHDLARGEELMAAVPSVHRTNPWVVAAQAVAEGKFTQAADQYAAIGSGPDEAYARLRAGEQLVVDGQGVDAVDQLKWAADFFGRAGALAYVSAAEDLLRRAKSNSL
jgi:class 3 adenylate cyclase/tetratricopeptide (TPR) repeat protein